MILTSLLSSNEPDENLGALFECIVGCKEGVKYWDAGGNEFDKNLNLISKN